MGITYVDGVVSNNNKQEKIKFLVDSGSTYSMLPKSVWEKLGLKSERETELILADGTVITRGISECYIVLPEGKGHTPVILGESDEDEPLLGAITLEEMGFILDPLKREIRPLKVHL